MVRFANLKLEFRYVSAFKTDFFRTGLSIAYVSYFTYSLFSSSLSDSDRNWVSGIQINTQSDFTHFIDAKSRKFVNHKQHVCVFVCCCADLFLDNGLSIQLFLLLHLFRNKQTNSNAKKKKLSCKISSEQIQWCDLCKWQCSKRVKHSLKITEAARNKSINDDKHVFHCIVTY